MERLASFPAVAAGPHRSTHAATLIHGAASSTARDGNSPLASSPPPGFPLGCRSLMQRRVRMEPLPLFFSPLFVLGARQRALGYGLQRCFRAQDAGRASRRSPVSKCL
ncbi:hypothetical protein VTI28DRAFT_1120 [Corynascus sepedonium]